MEADLPEQQRVTRESELIEKARRYLPAGSLGNLAGDVVIAGGSGSRITDISGNEYIDYLLGSGPMITGHAHPDVVRAVAERLESGSTFFANNEPAILLAEAISDAMECVDKVRFCSTGTEATLYAMRAARAFRGRDKILKFEGGFHGMNDYALQSMMPADPPDFPLPSPDGGGIPAAVAETMLIAPFNDIETTSAIIERHHDELGGVIVEPFQRLLPPRPGFLEGLREVTARYEIPLIFDEVVTSFRFAYGGAQEYYGVVPDLCSLGKAVAGGFPLTAVGGREEIMAHFDASAVGPGEWMPQIGTLSGNPVAATAGPCDGRDTQEARHLRADARHRRSGQAGARGQPHPRRSPCQGRRRGRAVRRVLHRARHRGTTGSTLLADKDKLGAFNRLLRERGVFKGDSKFYLSTAHDEGRRGGHIGGDRVGGGRARRLKPQEGPCR